VSKKTLFSISLFLLILVYSECVLNGAVPPVSASSASALKIYVGPNSVPADNSVYDVIFVQLVDSSGVPARALQDTTVRLSSSATNIGTVDPTVTIAKGDTYVPTKFYSTYTPGTTTITAASSGYMTVQAPITTVGPAPSTLAIYAVPPVLPADGNSYPAIIVQLQDSSGSPAKAPIGDVQVTLSSSNTAVGAVDSSVTIKGGKTYAVATFSTAGGIGSATVTAISSGYTSGQATVTTQKPSVSPSSLQVFVGPPKFPADGITYSQVVAVLFLNASGYIARAPSDTIVTLSSSNTNVGTVQPTLTIPQSQFYGLAYLNSTYRAGTTTITATATNATSAQASLTTVGPIPSKLAVYCVPASLPADNQPYAAIQVQLQGSAGIPAKDPVGNITVYLSSSTPSAGNVSSTLIIPFGQTYATGTFYSTYGASSVTITAQTSGYDSGQAPITTSLIDKSSLVVSLTTDPSKISSGMQANVTAYVTYDGRTGAPGATVQFTSDNGGNFTATQDQGNGYYNAVFNAPSFSKQTGCTITASASKTGYTSAQGSGQVMVNATIPTVGTILLHLIDNNGQTVSQASIISIDQPKDMASLSGSTNDTGDLEFNNVLLGNYTFQINKPGYASQNETILVSGNQTGYPSIIMSQTSSQTSSSGFPITTLIIIAVVVVIVIAVLIALVRRRQPPEIQYTTGKYRPQHR
jgi:hypothetical protein